MVFFYICGISYHIGLCSDSFFFYICGKKCYICVYVVYMYRKVEAHSVKKYV